VVNDAVEKESRMYTTLATTHTKTGAPLEIGVVLGPDETYRDVVPHLLSHKRPRTHWEIELAMQEPMEGLESRFYLGIVAGEPVANVMTAEYAGVGILAHVFTRPEFRRQGICNAIMEQQMEEFRQRGGRYMTLGTGYDRPPYHIYRGFGFESILPENGFMKYVARPGFEQEFFAPAAAQPRPAEWRDWPVLNVLFAQPGDHLRSLAYGLYGIRSIEGTFTEIQGQRGENPALHSAVLTSATGADVAWALMQPDSRWRGSVHLLDLHAHPACWDQVPALIASLPWPKRKVQCHCDATSDAKIAALEASGFRHEALMRDQLSDGAESVDVVVMARPGGG
jgi:GNAT superfamily N-acetyltransferase